MSFVIFAVVLHFYVKKPQLLCYDEVRRLAAKQLDGCEQTLSWCGDAEIAGVENAGKKREKYGKRRF